jgi:hypothetical protein
VVGDAVSVDALPRVSERGIAEWVASRLRVLRLKEDKISGSVKNPAEWPTDLTRVGEDLGIILR